MIALVLLVLVALWAFAEATVFFIVADVPISAIGLAKGWKPALLAALVCAIAAALGGLLLTHWSASDPATTAALLDRVPGIDPAMIDHADAAWRADGWPAMLQASFTGEPYKLYAHAAGAAGAPVAVFAPQSIAARLPRFVLVAALSSTFGQFLRPRLSRAALITLFAAFWITFYAAYFALVAH